jgi:hypothetical protein
VCNKWQANGVKLLGAFDGNPAGHVIAMLYKFGVDNGIFQNELTAVSLKVVGLFPSDLQVNGCPFWQSAFTPRCMPAVLGNIQHIRIVVEMQILDRFMDVFSQDRSVKIRKDIKIFVVLVWMLQNFAEGCCRTRRQIW